MLPIETRRPKVAGSMHKESLSCDYSPLPNRLLGLVKALDKLGALPPKRGRPLSRIAVGDAKRTRVAKNMDRELAPRRARRRVESQKEKNPLEATNDLRSQTT